MPEADPLQLLADPREGHLKLERRLPPDLAERVVLPPRGAPPQREPTTDFMTGAVIVMFTGKLAGIASLPCAPVAA